MKRYEAYDPIEYLNWQPDPEVMKSYSALAQEAIDDLDDVTVPKLIDLYKHLLQTHLHDITLKRWVKSGRISKAWLGCGEEAVTVGNVAALEKGDIIGPMIRNAGGCLIKGMPLEMALGYYLGVADTPSAGRDLHAGSLAYDVITPISHVAALVPVCTGLSMANKYKGSDRVVLTWIGDGSTRCGEFHEGINFAAVQHLPCIFVLQNNQIALGTKYDDHYKVGLDTMAEAYGVIGVTADGNNVVDVYRATRKALHLCREGKGPVLMTVNTFRMGGHASHDEAEARQLFDDEIFSYWGKRDPIACYEEFLVNFSYGLTNAQKGQIGQFAKDNRKQLKIIENEVENNCQHAADKALTNLENRIPQVSSVIDGVYAV